MGRFLSLPTLKNLVKKWRFPVEWEGGGPNLSGGYGPTMSLCVRLFVIGIQNSPVAGSWDPK